MKKEEIAIISTHGDQPNRKSNSGYAVAGKGEHEIYAKYVPTKKSKALRTSDL